MGFLQDYKIILVIFLVAGKFPATIHKHSKLFKQSNCSFAYSLAFSALHFVTSFYLLYTHFINHINLLIFIGIAANECLTFYMMCAYFFTTFLCVRGITAHIRLLNGLLQFDHTIGTSDHIQNSYRFDGLLAVSSRRRAMRAVCAAIAFTSLDVIVINHLQRPDQSVTDTIVAYDLIFMMNIMSLLILHMHFCTQLLNDRFDLIRCEIARLEYETAAAAGLFEWLIGRFCHLHKSRSVFGKVFSAIALTTTVNDQVQMALCTFMQMKHLGDYGDGRLVFTLIITNLQGFLFPAIRQIMIFGSMNRLAEQV